MQRRTEARAHLERCTALVKRREDAIKDLEREAELLQLCIVDCRGELQRKTSELFALNRKSTEAVAILQTIPTGDGDGDETMDVDASVSSDALKLAVHGLEEMQKRMAESAKNDTNGTMLERIQARSEQLEKERASRTTSTAKQGATPAVAGPVAKKRRRTSGKSPLAVAGTASGPAGPAFPVVMPTTACLQQAGNTTNTSQQPTPNAPIGPLSPAVPPQASPRGRIPVASPKGGKKLAKSPKARPPRRIAKLVPTRTTVPALPEEMVPPILSTDMNRLLAKKGNNIEEIRRYTPVRRFGTTFSISGALPVNNAYHAALPLLGHKLLATGPSAPAEGPQDAVWVDVCEFARVHRLGTPGSSSFEKDNLYALMRAVFRCGGMQVVVGMNAWKYVATTVAAGCEQMDYVKAKKFYAKWAYPYEHMLVFGEMVHKHVHLLLWRYNWKNERYPTTTVAKPPAPVARLVQPQQTSANSNTKIKTSNIPSSPERIQTPPISSDAQIEDISSSEQITVTVEAPATVVAPGTAAADIAAIEDQVQNDNDNNNDQAPPLTNKDAVLIPNVTIDNENILEVERIGAEDLSLPENTDARQGVLS